MTARRCDRCGAAVVDTVGSRQTSLFDAQADPRATDEARAELRSGRILCPACQRTPELPGMESSPGPWIDNGDGTERRSTLEAFPIAPVHITAPPDPFPRPVVDHWTRADRAAMRRAAAHVDAAEMADAVAGLE